MYSPILPPTEPIMKDPSADPQSQPTGVRYGVLGFACALSMITYLDRASFGNAEEQLQQALGLKGIGELTSAIASFSLAYALFEVPTGWLGDVFGPRNTLIRIVLWWSTFTALTGLAGIQWGGVVVVPLTVVVVIRFLFGVGEAGAYPNITRALHNWFPPQERGMTQGAVWMSGRLVGGLTPLIWTVLVGIAGVPWRWAFFIFGVIGLIWCVLFARWFRNRPDEKESVNNAELQLIRAGVGHESDQAHANVPWGRLLRSPTLWALCLMYFGMTYGWYFNLNQLPNYLRTQHDVQRDSLVGALYKGGPLIFGAMGCIVGGLLTDRYVRGTGNRRWGRRIFGIVGHCVCVPCYLYCVVAPNAFAFALAISLAGFFNDLAMGSAWAACQDIGRKHAAIVAGCMNTIGNLGGFAGGALTGWILDMHSKEEQLRAFNINFLIYAAVYAVTALIWFGIDATRPVLPEDTDPAVHKGEDTGPSVPRSEYA
jgi:MFS transporter, ACS family, glucarate transporter